MTQEEFVANQKSRRKRTSISHTNLNVLKKAFILEPFPSRQSVNKLSSEIQLPYRVIKVWFQNERAKKVKKFGRGAFKNFDITGQETSMADIQVITISRCFSNEVPGSLKKLCRGSTRFLRKPLQTLIFNPFFHNLTKNQNTVGI